MRRRGSYWCNTTLLRLRGQVPGTSQDWVRRRQLGLRTPSGSHLKARSYLDWRTRLGKISSAEIGDFEVEVAWPDFSRDL